MLAKNEKNSRSFIFLILTILLGLAVIFSPFNLNTPINEYESESGTSLKSASIII